MAIGSLFSGEQTGLTSNSSSNSRQRYQIKETMATLVLLQLGELLLRLLQTQILRKILPITPILVVDQRTQLLMLELVMKNSDELYKKFKTSASRAIAGRT